MIIQFATCNRERALQYIKAVYPSREISDTPESVGSLLNLVAKDIVRIQDPKMYGKLIGVVPGNNWDKKYCADVESACEVLLKVNKPTL